MIQENDKLTIPEEYRKMSVPELQARKERALAEIKAAPRARRKTPRNNAKVKVKI